MEKEKKLLEVEDLSIEFHSSQSVLHAVNKVSFSVKNGETLGLVGESGCGKSTTVKALMRLLPQNAVITGGSIKYEGQQVLDKKPEELRRLRGREVGMIFQDPMTALNPVLTIKKQIYEQFLERDMTRKEKYREALRYMNLVGIPDSAARINEYIHQFSGGMRQRAMIAITLAAGPRLLIADEPTTALDVTIQDQIIKLLNRLKEELAMSVLLITHDLGVVSQMSDKVAVMYGGFIVELAGTVELFQNPRHPYTVGLMGAIPNGRKSRTRLKAIPGTAVNLECLPAGCPFAMRCEYAEEKCRLVMPKLAQVSRGHFSRCHRQDKP